LKQAHIGVALLNGTQDDLTRIAEHARNTKMRDLYQKQVDLMKRWNQPAPPVPVLIAHLYPPGPSNPHYQKAMEREAQKKGVTVEELAKANGTNIETITSPAAQALIDSDPKKAKQVKA
jgi:cation-transporting ATPase 13A1